MKSVNKNKIYPISLGGYLADIHRVEDVRYRCACKYGSSHFLLLFQNLLYQLIRSRGSEVCMY